MKIKETEEYKQFPFKLRLAVDGILGLREEAEKKEKELQLKIDSLTDFQPAEKLVEYEKRPDVWAEKKNALGFSFYKPGSYSPEMMLKISAEELDSWLERNRVIYQKNIEICEKNKKGKSAAFTFLKKLGLEEERYDYVGRSKKKKRVTSEWAKELNNVFVTDCFYQFSLIENFVADQKNKIKDYLEKKEKEERDKKKKEENEVKEKEKIALIVLMVQKYGLQFNEPIPHINDVIEILGKKNKYLYLAYKLSQNREDWNDGYDYAAQGLNHFNSCRDELGAGENIDSDIIKDIKSYMYDGWDGDGRCFRDCEWNYDRLYGIARELNKQLYDDWSRLKEYIIF